jgi:hypothetical protein
MASSVSRCLEIAVSCLDTQCNAGKLESVEGTPGDGETKGMRREWVTRCPRRSKNMHRVQVDVCNGVLACNTRWQTRTRRHQMRD